MLAHSWHVSNWIHRKLIGARFYNSTNLYDIKSPRDSIGHGTHISSIAAGRQSCVAGVSNFGLTAGIARGGVPKARIAVYKVDCLATDVLAAFHDAVALPLETTTLTTLTVHSEVMSPENGQPINRTFARTVTNIGPPNSTYRAIVYAPTFHFSVEPNVLSFSNVDEKQSLTVKVSGCPIAQQPILSGYIASKDGHNVVRSPVIESTVLPNGTTPLFGRRRSYLMAGAGSAMKFVFGR
ncbi:hypothetical protein ACLOJK_006096 [Asimina triloba]